MGWSESADQFVHYLGVVFVFEGMDSFGQFFRCVVFEDFGAGLEDDVAAVVLFVYVVNGDARFLFAGFDHGTVYVHAVHAFAPVGWQQGGVDVDDALFEPAGDLGRYQAEKSGQDDEVDLVFLQFVQDFSAVQILPGEDYGGYGIFGGTFQYAGARVVRKDQGDVRGIGLAEVVDEVFCIGARARGENGDTFHLFLVGIDKLRQIDRTKKQKKSGINKRRVKIF